MLRNNVSSRPSRMLQLRPKPTAKVSLLLRKSKRFPKRQSPSQRAKIRLQPRRKTMMRTRIWMTSKELTLITDHAWKYLKTKLYGLKTF